MVDRHHAVVFGLVVGVDVGPRAYPRIVDEDADRAEPVVDLLEGRAPGVGAGDINHRNPPATWGPTQSAATPGSIALIHSAIWPGS
jgi:hypothetical protein